LPLDLAVSPDGVPAVVRGSEDGVDRVSFWELSGGIRFFPGGCTGTFANTAAQIRFSDLVAATNSRAVVIGSSSSTGIGAHNQAFIDVFAIDSTLDPPAASCLTNLPVPATGDVSTTGGDANDVAISNNGQWAVVNGRNWIHVITLSTGAVTGFNIGSVTGPFFNGPCSPDGAVDSIGITRTRAIVTTNRFVQNNRTWVYIINLTTVPPSMMLERLLGSGGPSNSQTPHDVAVSTGGGRAVVASNGVVAMFDLVNGTFLGEVEDGNAQRIWGPPPAGTTAYLRDSVEINSTDTRAVVISNHNGQGPQPRPFDWRVEVYDITGASLSLAVPPFDDDPMNPSSAHDLALTPDGTRAVVKCNNEVLIVSNLAGATSILGVSSAGDPTAGDVFCSDSVVTTNETAVTIGTTNAISPAEPEGIVDFITLSTGAKFQYPALTAPDDGGLRVTDLALTLADDGAVAVKTVARPDLVLPLPGEPPSLMGQDILVFTLGGVLVRRYGCNGRQTEFPPVTFPPLTALGADSLEVTTTRIVALSHWIDGGGMTGSGWVQIVQ
jgi:hypothetical protein